MHYGVSYCNALFPKRVGINGFHLESTEHTEYTEAFSRNAAERRILFCEIKALRTAVQRQFASVYSVVLKPTLMGKSAYCKEYRPSDGADAVATSLPQQARISRLGNCLARIASGFFRMRLFLGLQGSAFARCRLRICRRLRWRRCW